MIRPFRPEDIDDLIGVWLASTIPGQSFLPEEHWRTMEPVIRNELMPIADTWVIEDAGELVSFISLMNNLIGGLFTHPDHQENGHGRALIEHASKLHHPLLVEVFEANRRAIDFYRARGFRNHERHIDPESGLPLLILRLVEPTGD